jgi:transcriptional regulator with XRE-family HTH domain
MAITIQNDMQDPEFRKLLSQEELILEVTEFICKLMRDKKITRKQLADLLGKSKGFVSQLLNGGRNLTLRTLADIFYVLGYKIPHITPHKEIRQVEVSKIIEFSTWQPKLGLKWNREVSYPEGYFCDNTAISA